MVSTYRDWVWISTDGSCFCEPSSELVLDDRSPRLDKDRLDEPPRGSVVVGEFGRSSAKSQRIKVCGSISSRCIAWRIKEDEPA